MKFSKNIIATLFGITLATGVIASEKQHQTITIEAKDNGPAEVSIIQNGEQQVFVISQDALKDKELLLNELSGVSEEVQQHISQALSGLHSVSGAQIEIRHDSDNDKHRVWVQNDIEEVHVVEDQGNFAFVTLEDEDASNMKIIINQAQGLHHDSVKGASFNAIQHLLKRSELSADQLDILQGILDSKR